MKNKLVGREGESLAAGYLRAKGYKILASGYSCRYGEIDLIAQKGEIISFIEVKTRQNDNFAPAWQAVNTAKQERIKLTAMHWISENHENFQYRFDIIEVYMQPKRINHIENAFA